MESDITGFCVCVFPVEDYCLLVLHITISNHTRASRAHIVMPVQS